MKNTYTPGENVGWRHDNRSKQTGKELRYFYGIKYTYKKIVNCQPQDENKSFESFVEGIEISQLNTEERGPLEHDFAHEELKEAVGSFPDNKTPDEDHEMDSVKDFMIPFITSFGEIC